MAGTRSPLIDAISYYRDLGVRELWIAEPKAAAPPPLAVTAPEPVTVAVAVAVEPASAATAPPAPLPTLGELAALVAGCRRCNLCETRTQTVFADGSSSARIFFLGEAPGADEDAQGIPFVGKAGQLLTKMIENGMGIPRKDVYIANVLKCRPPGNRNPEPGEIEQCRGYLERQIELVAPEAIVALGNFAARFLLGTEEGIMRLRGRWGSYQGIPVMPTFHPSFLLRSPEKKKEAWSDLLEVMKKVGLPPPTAAPRAPRETAEPE